ncbi:uncharacterized protein LOC119305805 [Triticum dicoccoides]|uniref:uncharacterized protein LOC119305805 n=1 Tax=Triticum dicoccoides TaxID=85692 RepID=UPI00188EB025|nr:uncharacterized protein LOC119305805 [Triticum dicoccoides]
MGLLAINRLVSMQPDWRRRPTQGRNGLVTSSVAKRKGSPCSLHDDNSGSVKKSRCSGPGLPENLCIDALLGRQDVVHYPWADLLHMVPHLEDLEISSYCARDTQVVPGKFLHLQCLCIGAFNPDYDYLSLVSFLDACPSLETFILSVDAGRVRQESVLGESSHDLRQMPGHVHRNIKDVVIIGFCSAKSMVELTCHMLENAKSLEYLTLNTSSNPEILCSDSENGRCLPMSKHMRMEARRALLAVGRFILGKVPCSVELEVVKPCSRCNSLEI